jgi:hypothetical protein
MMTITQPLTVAGNLRNAEPYMCSCGETFSGLALLETHLDLLGDDSDAHVELAVAGDRCIRRVALGIRRQRIERGLPMRAMGELLGVNVSRISRIESGERRFGYLLVNPVLPPLSSASRSWTCSVRARNADTSHSPATCARTAARTGRGHEHSDKR